MSWIKEIEPEDSEGQLAEFYESLIKSRGKVSNIMKVQSLDVKAMETHMELYLSLMFIHSGLSREEMEMLATVVSIKNGCQYCLIHHGEALNNYWKDDARLAAFIENYELADITEKQMTMINYVAKLSEAPESMVEDDIDSLKSAGFSDSQILRINMIASYFNFVNRIAVGLGVEFSEEEMKGYKV